MAISDYTPEELIERGDNIPEFYLIVSPQCSLCVHVKGFRQCRAFDEIPLDVWSGERSHMDEIEGDGGITFTAVDPDDRQYIDPL